jgi:hypothetical protein
MTDRYPLTTKVLGLETVKMSQNVTVVCANDLERALEKGVRVYGGSRMRSDELWSSESDCTDHTRTALVIGIEPIVRDTAESLLREVIKVAQFGSRAEFDAWAERAKKVLGEK